MPRRLTYDNLKTTLYKILASWNRQEQESFKRFRSYYLYESNYCNPVQGHEKGGVENDVRYNQRNFMKPLLEVGSYEELNARLWKACQDNLHRWVGYHSTGVGDLLMDDRIWFLPLPGELFLAQVSFPDRLSPCPDTKAGVRRYCRASRQCEVH